MVRTTDGSAGDADYGEIGGGYAAYRRPDPRLFASITVALGNARTVLNVGAGAGSYEPGDRDVTPVEPSALRADLATGRWDDRHGALRALPTWNGSVRLIVARP